MKTNPPHPNSALTPAKRPLKKRPPFGTTSRIVANVVREDPFPLTMDRPGTVLEYWNQIIAAQPDFEPEKESLCVIMLNTRNRPYAWNRVSLGCLDYTIAEMREIFRPVIVAAASSFVLIHNHPSGDYSPSPPDEQLTNAVLRAAAVVGIDLMDHIIVPSGEPAPDIGKGYFSFREVGIIK